MTYLLLFLEFFKTGLFAVGGGLATIPFLYAMAEQYPWFSKAMLGDMIAVSESTPGPIGVNMATYAGFRAGGPLGSLVATVSLVLPSVIIIIFIAKMLEGFRNNPKVESIFSVLRPAVTGLIAAAGLGVLKEALFPQGFGEISWLVNGKGILLFLFMLLITNKWKTHPLVYLALGGGLGVIFAF